MTSAIGHGLDFHRSSDGTSGGTFSSVGEIIDFNLPGMDREAVETTHMLSTERFKEFIGGLKDAGEITFDTNFDPAHADTTAFLLELNTNTLGYYKIIFPDATEWGFSALMIGMEGAAPIDDRMTASFTFKLSGKPGFFA